MVAADGLGTGTKVVGVAAVVLLVVGGFGLGAVLSRPGRGSPAVAQREQAGYTFVYHPDSTLTVVKQEVTQHGRNLTLVGPSGSVGWTNASGGSTNLTAQFDLRRLGASPGSSLLVRERVGPNLEVTVANSTVPAHPRAAAFVAVFHQEPMVTVVCVDPHRTNVSNLELVGPKGSVAWDDATKSRTITARTTTFAATATSASFVYDGPALGATAGDEVRLVRVDPATGNRTTLLTKRIP